MNKNFKSLLNQCYIVFWLISLFAVVSVGAAVLSGPQNPTANSIPIFFNNKTLLSSGFVFDYANIGDGEFLINTDGTIHGTNSLTLASATITGNVTVNGLVLGNAAGLTNFLYVPNITTLFNTNAAILTNCVNYLVVTNNVRFTNWAAIAVSGQWFQICMTNSTGVNYYIDVPTNGFTRALTNATGSYVVADASGTNMACLLTNGQRAMLSGKFVGGNLNAGYFHFRHW